MKLKLLIAPLLILLIIVMAIWVVAPAYKELQGQKIELASAQLKLADIQEKNTIAAKLKQALVDNPAHKEMLVTYLPQKAQEEVIIENLSSLLQGEGLVVSSLSIAENASNNSAPAVDTVLNPSLGEVAPVVMAVNSIGVNVSFVGPYEKIKSFLDKLEKFKRGNEVVSLKISSTATVPGSLQADMVLNFSYFNGGNSAVSVNSSIFSKGSFDTSVIEQIKNKLSTNIIPVNIGTTGKANPFLP